MREVLTNPKYTGYMVYNRRSTKHGNKTNPASAWVWSPHRVHEPLVTRERFEQAQAVAVTLGAFPGRVCPQPQPRHQDKLPAALVPALRPVRKQDVGQDPPTRHGLLRV